MVARQKLLLAGLTVLSAYFFSGASLAAIEKSVGAPNGVKQLFAAGLLDGEKHLLVTGVLDRPPEFARDRIFMVLQVESLTFRDCELKASGTLRYLQISMAVK